MYRGITITPPFFEIGPKAYLYGKDVLKLARHADRLSAKYCVQVIFTPQYVDIPILARAVKNLLIFAQHMDSLPVGRGIGSVHWNYQFNSDSSHAPCDQVGGSECLTKLGAPTTTITG